MEQVTKGKYSDVRNTVYLLFTSALSDASYTVLPDMGDFLNEVYYKRPTCIESLIWQNMNEEADGYVTAYKQDFKHYYGVDTMDKQEIETILEYLTEDLEEELERE